jgi:acyl-CoA hydrolase
MFFGNYRGTMQGRVYCTSSYVIYVALDENRKPTPVPPLVPADDEEKEIIDRARIRRMQMQKIEKELALPNEESQ